MKVNNIFDLFLLILMGIITAIAVISIWKAFLWAGAIILGLILYIIIAFYIRKRFFNK